MPVSPQILAAIADPTGGRLGDIGKTYATAKQRSIENERAAEKATMVKQKFQQEQAIVGAKVTGAYAKTAIDWMDDNPNASAEEIRDKQLEIMGQYDEAHQGFIPESLQTREELQRGLDNSDTILRRFEPQNYQVDENELNKWQTELAMITKKNSDPENWTDTDQEQLDALSRQQNISISMRGPSRTEDEFATTSLKVLKKGDDILANNIENQQAYSQDLAAQKRKIMEEREIAVKSGKESELLSDAEATQLANEELKQHLQTSDSLFELTGYTNPFGKKYIYAPNRKEEETEEKSETSMKQPADLKEGEEGEFSGYIYKREGEKLKRKKVE